MGIVPGDTDAQRQAKVNYYYAQQAFDAVRHSMAIPRVLVFGVDRPRYISVHINGMAGWEARNTPGQYFSMVTMRAGERVVLGLESEYYHSPDEIHTRIVDHIAGIRALPLHDSAKLLITIQGTTGFQTNHIMELVRKTFQNVHFNLDDYRKPGFEIPLEARKYMRGTFVDIAKTTAGFGIYENFVTMNPDHGAILAEFRTQMLRQFDPNVIPGPAGRDEIAATVIEALFFGRNVFTDIRYRHML